MSGRRHPEGEAAEVAKLLEPLGSATANAPSSQTVYWRAQARLALQEAERRRSEVLAPIRLFYRALGAATMLGAVLVPVLSLFAQAVPGAELTTPVLLVVMVALGTFCLAEAREAS